MGLKEIRGPRVLIMIVVCTRTERRPPIEEDGQPVRMVKNWKRPDYRLPAERNPMKYVVSPNTNKLIPINEMFELRVMKL